MEQYSLANVVPTLCSVLGLTLPSDSNGLPIDPVINLCNGKQIDRVLFFSPDAIGKWLFERYADEFAPVLSYLPVKTELQSVMPSVTPVCYATMLSGAMPSVHGIQKYIKYPLTIDTIFNALARSGKRSVIIAKEESSCEIIFKNAPTDVIVCKDDKSAHAAACAVIDEDKYDFVLVYECEYDDNMHQTEPLSDFSLDAMRYHVKSATELFEYARKKWAHHVTLATFSPDHGIHTDPITHLGTHGTSLPDDMEIYHLWGVL